MGRGHILVMNLFSVGLCAPPMNEALLYTSLLPLQTLLQVANETLIISDTQYACDM